MLRSSVALSAELPEPIARALRDIVAPMVEGDGGLLYVVATGVTGAAGGVGVRLHLAGACGGCPGVRTTTQDVIEPVLRAAGARGPIEVSSGWIIPEGAERVVGPESSTTERDAPLRRSR